jgi:transposase InsO family protein
MKIKSERFEKFNLKKICVEFETNIRINTLRSGRGGEFLSNAFILFSEEHVIQQELTTTYTPHHNGVVERKNRTIQDRIRSMCVENNYPPFLWSEIVDT